MTAAETLHAARLIGAHLSICEGDLLVEAPSEPPAEIINGLRHNKIQILALLRQEDRAAEQTTQVDEWGLPPLPEILDRVKHPKLGDMPTYAWVRSYPSGGDIPNMAGDQQREVVEAGRKHPHEVAEGEHYVHTGEKPAHP